jgi:hypothetical protein
MQSQTMQLTVVVEGRCLLGVSFESRIECGARTFDRPPPECRPSRAQLTLYSAQRICSASNTPSRTKAIHRLPSLEFQLVVVVDGRRLLAASFEAILGVGQAPTAGCRLSRSQCMASNAPSSAKVIRNVDCASSTSIAGIQSETIHLFVVVDNRGLLTVSFDSYWVWGTHL